jgi:hypothetical protein
MGSGKDKSASVVSAPNPYTGQPGAQRHEFTVPPAYNMGRQHSDGLYANTSPYANPYGTPRRSRSSDFLAAHLPGGTCRTGCYAWWARATYAEGLTEPRFTPSAPLRPDKKYEWSVRLRRGDTVSSWSTTSFSLNLLIAGRSNSRSVFGFETPAQ